MTVENTYAGLELGRIVELLSIDLTPVGGGLFNIYNGFDESSVLSGNSITFKSLIFSPVPFTTSGWGYDGTGGTPRPEITIADFAGVLMAEVQENDDLIGCVVRRWETTYDFLATDEGYGPEIYIINQVIEMDGFVIKWQLANPMDQKQRKLPARQMFRNSFPALARTRVR